MSKNRGKKVQKKHQHEDLLNFTFENVGPFKENMQCEAFSDLQFF